MDMIGIDIALRKLGFFPERHGYRSYTHAGRLAAVISHLSRCGKHGGVIEIAAFLLDGKIEATIAVQPCPRLDKEWVYVWRKVRSSG